MRTDDLNGQELCDRFKKLESDRRQWECEWRDLARFIQPRKAQVITSSQNSQNPDTSAHDALYDTTGMQSNQTLARGQLAWMTPQESPWFDLQPGPELDIEEEDEEAKDWLSDCVDTMRRELTNGSFYTEVHECYLDRGGLGTTLIFVDGADHDSEGLPGSMRNRTDPNLFIRNYPVGTFVCGENSRGKIDEVAVKHNWSAKQAAEEFGYNNLPREVREQCDDPTQWDAKSDYFHFVYKRNKKRVVEGSPIGLLMPFVSAWVHMETKTIIHEGGYHEMPYLVSRFLEWDIQGENAGPYGYCPGMVALPDIVQLNYLESTLDSLADRQVNPPFLMPDGMDSRVDLRPGGETLFDPDTTNMPAVWMHGGRYDIGVERALHKRERIREIFMVGLFEMFAKLDSKEMTATEVQARLQEKIDQFSPTFQLLSNELLQPLVKRVFNVLLRAGKFPEPPPSMITVTNDGSLATAEPAVEFTSRLALAIKSAKNDAALRSFGEMEPFLEIAPEIIDNFKPDQIVRDLFRGRGGPTGWLRDIDERDEMRASRARQAQMQAMIEQQSELATAA